MGDRISPRLQVCFFLNYVLTFVLEEVSLKTGTAPVPKTQCVKFQYLWSENSARAPNSNKNSLIRARMRPAVEKQFCRVIECRVVAGM
jgi:hypothetical protein